MGSHYLDHASTSPLRPEARAAIADWMASDVGEQGDPGRVHTAGRSTRVAVENAREQVAAFLGARPREVMFTSSGTEAINTAVFGAATAGPSQACILAAAVEHSAVREASERARPTVVVDVDVDGYGRIDAASVGRLLGAGDDESVALVHCQLANHEVGTLQPCAAVVEMCREAGVLVHVDAVAAIGNVPFDFAALGADLCSVSSHKIGGPPGVGALLIRRGLRLDPLLLGGEQERAWRGGYENTLGIIGFGAVAAALAAEDPAKRSSAAETQTAVIRHALAAVAGVRVLGDPEQGGRLPNLVCAAVDGVESEAVLLALDRAGISVHSGSACSSESLRPSPVLAAMGADADRSLRVSVGWSTTKADVTAFCDELPRVVERLRALAP